jgi:hypothetical protein
LHVRKRFKLQSAITEINVANPASQGMCTFIVNWADVWSNRIKIAAIEKLELVDYEDYWEFSRFQQFNRLIAAIWWKFIILSFIGSAKMGWIFGNHGQALTMEKEITICFSLHPGLLE